PAFSLLFFLVALLFLEPIIARQKKALWTVYIVVQIAIMVILFFLEPDGDTFSLLLLPATMFVMRYYQRLVAWLWVGVFSIVMSAMLFYGHQEYAPALIVIYLVAYILVASFSLTIRQYKEVQQELVDANKQLRDYNEQVELLTAENERNHLARELHDSVTQTIFSMTLITSSTRILQESGSDQVGGKLEELQNLAQSALKEMRALITQLRPISISDDGLYPVLSKHIKGLNKRNDVNITLEKNDADLWLNRNQQQEVFRIVQEALNNVIKHANAKGALVKFEQSPKNLLITISDDGEGFDMNGLPESHHHFGLESMQQRATELNGTLTIESQPGKGTSVICNIQMKENEL
nr:hypothetical protein [Fodinibius sp.]NIV96868.1 hypothetical protein [candidate division KSB1 bacterium]